MRRPKCKRRRKNGCADQENVARGRPGRQRQCPRLARRSRHHAIPHLSAGWDESCLESRMYGSRLRFSAMESRAFLRGLCALRVLRGSIHSFTPPSAFICGCLLLGQTAVLAEQCPLREVVIRRDVAVPGSGGESLLPRRQYSGIIACVFCSGFAEQASPLALSGVGSLALL